MPTTSIKHSTASEPPAATSAAFGAFASALEYMADSAQRTVLFWDVMRQRGNAYRNHLKETIPHVLQ
jgi:hypothetical protein